MNALKFKLALPLFVALAYGPAQALAVPLLSADLASFAVLGATTVTNVPTSTIVGGVGAWNVAEGALTAITGFCVTPGVACADPQVTGGKVEAGTALAASAQGGLTTARTNLGMLGLGTVLGADLTGLTLSPGVYSFAAGAALLTGAVTLNGGGDPNAFWVFEIASTLTTASDSKVNVSNTGSGAGVFWNVGSSATLGPGSTFEGNILALTSISLDSTAKILCGRALADNGAVTMSMNAVSIGCAGTTGGESGSNGLSGSGLDFVGGTVVDTTTGTVVSVPGTAVPEPGTLALLGIGLLGFARRFRRSLTG